MFAPAKIDDSGETQTYSDHLSPQNLTAQLPPIADRASLILIVSVSGHF